MSTIDAIKAALVNPPGSSKGVGVSAEMKKDAVEISTLGAVKKSSGTQNIGAKKKKKIENPPFSVKDPKTNNVTSSEAASSTKTSKLNKAGQSANLQVPGQSNKPLIAPKKKLAKYAIKSPGNKHKANSKHFNSKPVPKHPTNQLSKPKPTGQASVFTDQQMEKLNLALSKNKEPGLVERRALAKDTNLSEFQVRSWFKKAKNNDEKVEASNKDVNRPHFLASKLVQASDARRHMEKTTTNKTAKNTVNKTDKKLKKTNKTSEKDVGEKKPGFGGIFTSLRPGTSKTKEKSKFSQQQKGSSFKKIDIPVLSSMNQILQVMNSVNSSDDKNGGKKGRSADNTSSKRHVDDGTSQVVHNTKAVEEVHGAAALIKESEQEDLEVLVLDEVEKPLPLDAEVIDIIDVDDQPMDVDGSVDHVHSKVDETDKNPNYLAKGRKGTKKSIKSDEQIDMDNSESKFRNKEADIHELRESNEKLLKELKEKTKIVQNLEVKIPQMISEFTKCVSDKDEVISAKDKEIKTNKQKQANLEKDVRLLQNRNKNTSSDLALRVKEVETLKKEIARDSKERLEHLQKMDGLDFKIAKLLGVLAKKEEEIAQLNIKSKEMQKKDEESRKLLAKEKEVSLKLKSKDKDLERKNKAKSQENVDKVKELERIIKVKDHTLKEIQNNDSINSKTALDSLQKQIVKMRSTIKFQEKEMQSMKEKESRLSVQVADLECDNYTKSAELECKNAELDKIMNKGKSGKSSDRKKLSIYEATKDYIEKLKENRKLRGNLKTQEGSGDAIEVIDVEEEEEGRKAAGKEEMEYNIFSSPVMLEQMSSTTGARPKVASKSTACVVGINTGEHQMKNDSNAASKELISEIDLEASPQLIERETIQLVRRIEVNSSILTPVAESAEPYLSMVSHQCGGVVKQFSSMVSHQVWQVEDDTIPSLQVSEPSGDNDGTHKKHPRNLVPVQAVRRKMLYRSSTGVWGQVYRARGLHQEVVARRALKRRASVKMDECIPFKRRKLMDLLQNQNNDGNLSLVDQNHKSNDSLPSTMSSGYLSAQASMVGNCTDPYQNENGYITSMVSHHLPDLSTAGGQNTSSYDAVLYSSMVTHKLSGSQNLNSCSFLSHTENASYTLPSISFLSYNDHPKSTVCAEKPSILSHRAPRLSQSSNISFLSHLAVLNYQSQHYQSQHSYSFYSHQFSLADTPVQDYKPPKTKRSLKDDGTVCGPLPKKRKMPVNQQLVSELLLELISEQITVQDLKESLLVGGEATCIKNIEDIIGDHQSFLTHQVFKVEVASSDKSSFLSHQVGSLVQSFPYGKPSHLAHQVTVSNLDMQSHFQSQHSHSFYSHQVSLPFAPVLDYKPPKTKRSLEEDTPVCGPLQKKRKLPVNQQLVSELLLEVISEQISFQDLQGCLLAAGATDTCSRDSDNSGDHQSFLTHQVLKVDVISSDKCSFLSHQVGSLVQSFPYCISSHLAHQVTVRAPADMQSLLSHKTVTVNASPYSSSLLCYQVSPHMASPDLLSSLVHTVRASPINTCLTSLLTHLDSHPVSHLNLSSTLSLQAVPSLPSILPKVLTNPQAGGRKRRLEDTQDSPDNRKMVRLSSMDRTEVLSSISASCKREREDDDQDFCPPPKRLKMSRLCGITLHYKATSSLLCLPQPKCEWQVVKYSPRKTLLDMITFRSGHL